MRTFIWIVIAITSFTSSLPAQPTQAQYDSLKARIVFLESITGASRWKTAAIPCPQMEANRPATTFPNGEYDLSYRNRQFGCAFDPVVEKQAAQQAQLTGALSRIAAIESSVAGGQPVGTAVFDKIRVNQICLGEYDCDSDWQAPFQIRTNGRSFIGGESNLNGSNPQSPHSHLGQISIGGDGGIRIDQNCKMTYSAGFKCYIDPCREWSNVGTDSRGSWSYYRGGVTDTCVPVPHDPTQDFVLTTDEGARETRMYIWRPNWGLSAIGSSCLVCMDKPQSIVPKQ